jgi:hypothetical protein
MPEEGERKINELAVCASRLEGIHSLTVVFGISGLDFTVFQCAHDS